MSGSLKRNRDEEADTEADDTRSFLQRREAWEAIGGAAGGGSGAGAAGGGSGAGAAGGGSGAGAAGGGSGAGAQTWEWDTDDTGYADLHMGFGRGYAGEEEDEEVSAAAPKFQIHLPPATHEQKDPSKARFRKAVRGLGHTVNSFVVQTFQDLSILWFIQRTADQINNTLDSEFIPEVKAKKVTATNTVFDAGIRCLQLLSCFQQTLQGDIISKAQALITDIGVGDVRIGTTLPKLITRLLCKKGWYLMCVQPLWTEGLFDSCLDILQINDQALADDVHQARAFLAGPDTAEADVPDEAIDALCEVLQPLLVKSFDRAAKCVNHSLFYRHGGLPLTAVIRASRQTILNAKQQTWAERREQREDLERRAAAVSTESSGLRSEISSLRAIKRNLVKQVKAEESSASRVVHDIPTADLQQKRVELKRNQDKLQRISTVLDLRIKRWDELGEELARKYKLRPLRLATDKEEEEAEEKAAAGY
jgi:hypothetical protein